MTDKLSTRLAACTIEEAKPLLEELYDNCLHAHKGGNHYAEFEHHLAYQSGYLSAVVMLVPEGHRYGGEQDNWHDDPRGICEAWLWPFESIYDPDWKMGQETQRSNPDGNIATACHPAVALASTIAAAMERNNDR